MPPRALSPGSGASFLPAGWGAARFPLSFRMRCPYPYPLQLLRRSKCGLLAPDWWSLDTYSTLDFKSQCPNTPAPSLASNPPAPPGPHLNPRHPSTHEPQRLQNPPCALGIHPARSPQPRLLPDPPIPGRPAPSLAWRRRRSSCRARSGRRSRSVDWISRSQRTRRS